MVDDGGEMFRREDEGLLVISKYITDGTRVKLLYDNELESEVEVKKRVRRKTGQLVANCTGWPVMVEHDDGSSEVFNPED